MVHKSLQRTLSALVIAALCFSLTPTVSAHNSNGDDNDKKASKNFVKEQKKDDKKDDKRDDKTAQVAPAPLRFVLVQGQVTAGSGAALPAQLTVKVSQSSPRLLAIGQSVTVQVNEKSKIINNLFGQSSLAQLGVGDKVQIFGQLSTDGSIIATSVKNESALVTSRRGTVDSVNSANKSFIMSGTNSEIKVLTNSDTVFKATDGSTVTFVNVTVAAKVQVTGLLHSGGSTMVAQKVLIEMVKPTPLPISFVGHITALSGTALPATTTFRVLSVEPTLNDSQRRSMTQLPNDTITVTIDRNTKLRAHTGETITLKDITLGDHIAVQANLHTNGTLTATKIIDNSLTVPASRTKGTITSVDATKQTFVVSTTEKMVTVKVDADTKISLDNASRKTFADLHTGDSVIVTGYMNSSTQVLLASTVSATSAPINLPFSFSGNILSLNRTTLPATITVRISSIEPPIMAPFGMRAWYQNPNDIVTVTIDRNTVLQSSDGKRFTLAQFRFNDKLSVQSKLTSDGKVMATVIKNNSLSLNWE